MAVSVTTQTLLQTEAVHNVRHNKEDVDELRKTTHLRENE